jgi:hypothetical protein
LRTSGCAVVASVVLGVLSALWTSHAARLRLDSVSAAGWRHRHSTVQSEGRRNVRSRKGPPQLRCVRARGRLRRVPLLRITRAGSGRASCGRIRLVAATSRTSTTCASVVGMRQPGGSFFTKRALPSSRPQPACAAVLPPGLPGETQPRTPSFPPIGRLQPTATRATV